MQKGITLGGPGGRSPPGIFWYIYIYILRELNLNKTTYALHLCRCPCGNIPKPTHEIPKPKSIQNIKYSTPHYHLWKRVAIPSPSSNPELLHLFLEPLVRRSIFTRFLLKLGNSIAKAHTLRGLFLQRLRDTVFMVNPEDLEQVLQTMQEEEGLTDEELTRRYYKCYGKLISKCRRKIGGVSMLLANYDRLMIEIWEGE